MDGSYICPSQYITNTARAKVLNPQHTTWLLIDQNLATALYSVISQTILPYVLSLDHCSEIWATVGKRLQSTTRARVSQLKNELQQCSMKDMSMAQYLLEIKSKVDALAAAGITIDSEDVIHHTLNGLPGV